MLLFTTCVCWPDWEKVNNGRGWDEEVRTFCRLTHILTQTSLRVLLLISSHHICWPVQTTPSLMWSFMLLQLQVAASRTSRVLHPHAGDPHVIWDPHLRTGFLEWTRSDRTHHYGSGEPYVWLTSRLRVRFTSPEPELIQSASFKLLVFSKRYVRIQQDPYCQRYCHKPLEGGDASISNLFWPGKSWEWFETIIQVRGNIYRNTPLICTWKQLRLPVWTRPLLLTVSRLRSPHHHPALIIITAQPKRGPRSMLPSRLTHLRSWNQSVCVVCSSRRRRLTQPSAASTTRLQWDWTLEQKDSSVRDSN